MDSQNKTTFGYTPEEYKKFKLHGWIYLILFSLLYCTIYCTRNSLASAGAQMIDELGWTTANIGLITGILFWTYGLGQLVSGRLSEIFGENRFIVLAVILSSVVNVLAGLTTNLWVIAVLWGLNGFFQSMAWAPGVACLMKWWPGKTHGFAVGFANAFAGFGGALSQLSVVYAFKAFPSLGFRAAFFIPAAIPMIMLVVYLILTKVSPEKIGLTEYAEEDPEKAAKEREMKEIVAQNGPLYPYKYILSNRLFVIWLIISFVAGVARYGLTGWVPVYFHDKFGIEVTEGLIQSLVLPVGMGVGTLVMPAISDVVWKQNRIYHVILSSLVSALSIGAFLLLDPRVPAQMVLIEVLLFVAGFFIYAITGIGGAYAADLGGRVFAGTSSGVLNFACYMGSAVQAMVYGFLQRSFGWGIVFASMAIFCLLVTVLAVVTVLKDKKKTK